MSGTQIHFFKSLHISSHLLLHDVCHRLLHLTEVLHVHGVHVRLADEALGVWVLRGEGSQGWLHLHELAAASVQGWADARIQEVAAVGDGFQWSRSFVGEAQPDEQLRSLDGWIDQFSKLQNRREYST